MDFNRAFYSYDDMEGANCQTMFWEKVNQKDAAILAVKKIGLNQKKKVDETMFQHLPQFYAMFCRRLELLKFVEAGGGE